MKEEELESDCRKSEHNYNKRLSNILIQKRTKKYNKKSGIREEAKSREKERDRERLRERERKREIEGERERAKEKEIERENVEWILIRK